MGVFSENSLIDILYWTVILLTMVGVAVLTYKLTQKQPSVILTPEHPKQEEPHPASLDPDFHPVDPAPGHAPTPTQPAAGPKPVVKVE